MSNEKCVEEEGKLKRFFFVYIYIFHPIFSQFGHPGLGLGLTLALSITQQLTSDRRMHLRDT